MRCECKTSMTRGRTFWVCLECGKQVDAPEPGSLVDALRVLRGRYAVGREEGADDWTWRKLKKLDPEGSESVLALNLHKKTHVADLAHVVAFPGLKHLDLTNVKLGDDDLAALVGRGLEGLTSLDLMGTRVTDEGLAALEKLPQLEALRLSFTKIKGPGLAHVAKLSKLTALDLSDCKIKGPGLEHLAGLSLDELDLSDTKVGDEAMPRVKELTSLTELDLSGTKVTAQGLASLKGRKYEELFVDDDLERAAKKLKHR